MRHRPHRILCAAALIAGWVPSALVRAAPSATEPHPAAAPDLARIEADLARLQQDVREQRQLIFQLMQMHDALLKYLQMGGGVAGGSGFAPPPPPTMGGASGNQPPAKTADSAPAVPSPSAATRGAISGKVRSSAGSVGEAYVYLDGPKILASRSSTIEIKQLARQFVPAVSVVQVGTRILFPNEDRIFHNVFSRTPGDAFDLGTLKSGDRPSPVVLLKPGHVEVFCNIHSKMRADILVVPNGYWTRVRPDGSFQLSGVPLGSHRVVLWGPALKPTTQRVELTSGVASTVFSTDRVARRPHLNKQGGAYESYED